ncbi:MAG: macro domain-containing protein [Rhodobacteraceae bacterium]|nr:macro domain-containing protein [Paracoccaceae bacterium]
MITYLTGDATAPVGEDPAIIAHVCNDAGGWGRGFVMAISARWPEPEADYRAWAKGQPTGFALGETRLIPVTERLQVANMVAQHGFAIIDGHPPIRYEAVRRCLTQVAEAAAASGASVHMPRIGCGLAGGRWEEIEPILKETLIIANVPTHVYDFSP